MKLKILQINKFYYLRGGSERYMFLLSDLLSQHGHKVIPFSMQDKRNKESDYSKYFVTNMDMHKFCLKNIVKYFYNYEAATKLTKLIKKEKPDIAHLHNFAHQLSPSIIRVLKKNHIPIIQTLHDYKLICPNTMLYNKKGNCEKCRGGKYYNCFLNSCLHESRAKSFLAMLEAYLHNIVLHSYQQIDLFLAPSRFMKEICEKFFVPSKKIKVIRNFNQSDKHKALANTNTCTKEDEKYLLYFGRLAKEKGIGTVISALINLPKEKIKFLIVGSGPEEKNLRKKIKFLKITNQVKILGFKTGNELKELVDNAEAIIMPSLWPENMPYSSLEALQAGKIIIATKVGGQKELVNDGISGFLYKKGDYLELADKINQVMALSVEQKLKMSTQAREIATQTSQAEHYQKIIAYYKKLINQ